MLTQDQTQHRLLDLSRARERLVHEPPLGEARPPLGGAAVDGGGRVKHAVAQAVAGLVSGRKRMKLFLL